jgi:hypothetical protein
MSDELNVISRTQVINIEPTSGSVSIINAGPQGPAGSSGGVFNVSATEPPDSLLVNDQAVFYRVGTSFRVKHKDNTGVIRRLTLGNLV